MDAEISGQQRQTRITNQVSLEQLSHTLLTNKQSSYHLGEVSRAINSDTINDDIFRANKKATYELLSSLHLATSGATPNGYILGEYPKSRSTFLESLVAIEKISNFLMREPDSDASFSDKYYLGNAAVEKLSDMAFHTFMYESSCLKETSPNQDYTDKLQAQAEEARAAIQTIAKIITTLGKEQVENAISMHADDIIARSYHDVKNHPRLLASRISILNELLTADKETALINPASLKLVRTAVEYCKKVLEKTPNITDFHQHRELINLGLTEMREQVVDISAKQGWVDNLDIKSVLKAARKFCVIGPDGYGQCTGSTMAIFANRIPDRECTHRLTRIILNGEIKE
jgi:hypothetical protein